MKAKRALILLLTFCLTVMSLCLSVAAEETTAEPAKGLSTAAIVSLVIGGALLIFAVIMCVVKREKVAESLRSYKSEMKKITWFPGKQVVACTVFVIVSVIAIAVVVGLLDYAFFQGQNALPSLFGKNG